MSNYNLIFARVKTLSRVLQVKLAKEILEDVVEESPKEQFPMMSLGSEPGDKIRFSYPDNGYPSDQKQVADYKLVKGAIYTVAQIHVGGFTSSVRLAEVVPHIWFNAVHFSPV